MTIYAEDCNRMMLHRKRKLKGFEPRGERFRLRNLNLTLSQITGMVLAMEIPFPRRSSAIDADLRVLV
jgi:hypothetical protein